MTEFEPTPDEPRERSRRHWLRGVSAIGALAVAAPALVRSARASAGELNFMGWAGYDGFPAVFAQFEAKTGIKVNFSAFADQDEMLAHARAGAGRDGAFDIAEPTADRLASWTDCECLQPWDERKINLEGAEAAFVSGRAQEMMSQNGKRMGAPSVWGMEAICYHAKQAKVESGAFSLMSLFDPAYVGKVALRGHSGLAVIGRALERTGGLPYPYADAYVDESKMTAIYDVILPFAIARRKSVARFWSGESEAQSAFRDNACVIGCAWDTTAFNLIQDGLPIGFAAPKEGAMGWVQNFVLLKGARNVEQANAWVSWINTADGNAAWARAFGANGAAQGAIERADDAKKKFNAAAFPGDVAKDIFWWPATPPWFVAKRTDYARKFMSA